MAQVQPRLDLKKQQQQHASRGINCLPKEPQEGLLVPHLGSVFLGDQREFWFCRPLCSLVNCLGIGGYFGLLSLPSEGHTVPLSSSLFPSLSLYLHFFLSHSEVSHRSRRAEGGQGQRQKKKEIWNLFVIEVPVSVTFLFTWRQVKNSCENHVYLESCKRLLQLVPDVRYFAWVLISPNLFNGGDVQS